MGLVHAATSLPNHITSELQIMWPPVGVAMDMHIEDGGFVLGDSAGLGIRVDEEAIMACTRRPATPLFDGPGVRPERAGHRLLSEPRSRRPASELTPS
jgi:hypothetical protein